MRRRILTLIVILLSAPALSGCLIIGGTALVTGAAISVTGTALETAGNAGEAVIGAVIPGDEDDDENEDDD